MIMWRRLAIWKNHGIILKRKIPYCAIGNILHFIIGFVYIQGSLLETYFSINIISTENENNVTDYIYDNQVDGYVSCGEKMLQYTSQNSQNRNKVLRLTLARALWLYIANDFETTTAKFVQYNFRKHTKWSKTWGIASSGTYRRVYLYLLIDVSGQPIGTIFMDQASDMKTDRKSRNVSNKT